MSTAEVAEVLGAHPSILEANVYGVSLPNHDGRAGCACVVISGSPTSAEGGSFLDAPESVQEGIMKVLGAYVEARLPKYARPIFLRATRAMETTGSNKHVKHELRVQGVNPELVGGEDRVWWLKGGRYVRFGKKDWGGLVGGSVKL